MYDDREPRGGIPARIGPCRILRVLGEGGAAVVCLAEQVTPFRRQVALKLLKGTIVNPDRVARFEQELHTLARLHHENIAQVFDLAARGRESPYFTMEFVDGRWITEHCDPRSLGAILAGGSVNTGKSYQSRYPRRGWAVSE